MVVRRVEVVRLMWWLEDGRWSGKCGGEERRGGQVKVVVRRVEVLTVEVKVVVRRRDVSSSVKYPFDHALLRNKLLCLLSVSCHRCSYVTLVAVS